MSFIYFKSICQHFLNFQLWLLILIVFRPSGLNLTSSQYQYWASLNESLLSELIQIYCHIIFYIFCARKFCARLSNDLQVWIPVLTTVGKSKYNFWQKLAKSKFKPWAILANLHPSLSQKPTSLDPSLDKNLPTLNSSLGQYLQV